MRITLGNALAVAAIVLSGADLSTHVFSPSHAFSQPATYARFSGRWTTHSGGLYIGPHGKGWYTLRTYTTCNQHLTTNCDAFIGNFIYNGGVATFSLNSVSGNTASGVITYSAASWQFRTPIGFTYKPNHTLIMHTVGGYNGVRFCTRQSPPSACGA